MLPPGPPAPPRWSHEPTSRPGQGPAQALRRQARRRRPGPEGRARRDLRRARAERRGQDHHRRDPRGLPQARQWRGLGARRGPAARRAGLAQPDRHRPAVRGRPRRADRRRDGPPLRGLLPRRPRRGRGHRGRRADRQGRPRGPGQLSGWPAAPPRRRARHRRPPGAALPRRADHRVRPGGPAFVLGPDRGPARGRHDGAAHHALHGRGRAPRGPLRRRPRRPDRRSRRARRARRRAASSRPPSGGTTTRAHEERTLTPRPSWPTSPPATVARCPVSRCTAPRSRTSTSSSSERPTR